MRILFVGRRYWPAVGGVESLMRDLAQELAARHEVRVLSLRIDDGPLHRLSDSLRPPRPFEPFRDGPVSVEPLRLPVTRRALMTPLVCVVIPGLRRYAYGRARVAAAALYAHVVAPLIARRAKGFDVVHVWGGDLLAAAAVRAARLVDVPVVVMPSAHPGQWGDDPASASAYRKADRVLAHLASDAELYRRLGVPASRVVVCGACTRGLRAGEGEAIRRRFSIDGPLVTFLGVRRAHKGHDLLLDAAALVARARHDVTFAFVGPGSRLATPNGARVIDVGGADHEVRDAWVDASNLICLPSSGESFGIAVIEAWSLAKPVVVSDAPALRELVEMSGGGVTVPRDPRALSDRILDLLADPAFCDSLGRRGHACWSSRFTVASVAATLERTYAAVASHGARSDRRLARDVQLETRAGSDVSRLKTVRNDDVPTASVVIATRNRVELLRRCLDALARQATRRTLEVVVVDDGGEPPLAASDLAALPAARLVRGEGRGPAAARNLGLQAAQAPVVLFTDDDTEPDPSWLEAACSFLEGHPECVGVGGATVSPPFDYLYEESVECEVPAYWTCNVAYRKRVLDELGGFCEAFPWPRHEDLDLGYRALRHGPIGFEPRMRVVHVPRPASIAQLVARGRFVASDALLASRHRDRYRVPRVVPRTLVPLLALARDWQRRLRAEGAALARSPRRLARFLLVAAGQLAVAFVTAVATSVEPRGARR
ncbi:MAG TPA: glycosyltransferase [Gaiellaceae bacterium]|nr:glycosyltransferase [Gaiellaceae bacterium]